MKKALLCCLSIVAAFSSHGQNSTGNDQFFIYLGAGYNAPHAGNFYNNNGFGSFPINGTENLTSPSNVNVIDYKKASYTSGLDLRLGATYMFNQYLGADLGVNIIAGPKKYSYDFTQTYPAGNVITNYETQLAMPIYIMPSFVVSTGSRNPFNAYARMGLAFPIGGKMTGTTTQTDNVTNDVYVIEEEYKLGMSKGLQGGLGFTYRVSPALNIFGEARGMALTQYVKSSEVTVATDNGVDDLVNWTTEQKETTYSSKYTYDPVTQTASVASKSPTLSIPSSNFGVSVGARLGFGDLGIKNSGADTNAPIRRAYASLGVGFGMPHAGNFSIADGVGANPILGSETYNSSTGLRTLDFKKASYGSGVNVNVAGGYWLNPHFAAEIGVNIGVAPKANEYTYDAADSTGPIYGQVTTTKAKMPVYITPAFVISTGCNNPFNVYARAGIVLPIGGKIITNTVQTIAATNDVYEEEEEFMLGMSKGLTGALGVNYNLNSSLGLYAEFAGQSLTRYTKSSEVTKSTLNGVDQLATYSVFQRETEYNFNTTFDPATVTPGNPRQAQTLSMPYSFWGLSLGARFRF